MVRHKTKFYYVYVLYNSSQKFIYVGFTEDLISRFKEHDIGRVTSTKDFVPLELIHYETYRNKKDALRRENYLKTTKGRTTLRTMLKEYFSIHKSKKDNSGNP